MIPFSRHVMAPNELEHVRDALTSGATSGDGRHTRAASALLSAAVGGSPVLLTTSCSHALEMAVMLCDLGPGDEVIVPSFTFSSSANAVRLRGASIRFADIDAGSWSMGPDEALAAWTPRTRAVMAVAYNGISHRIDALAALCEARGVPLLLDAAQSFGAVQAGRPGAAWGRVAAMSFHATKNLSSGEGGALILNDRSLLHRAEMIREKGTDRGRFLRGEIDKYTWRTIGSSYLPSDVLAAVLRAQLEAGDAIQAHRHSIWNGYHDVLAHAALPGLALQQFQHGDQHPAHMFALLVPDAAQRPAFVAALGSDGIKAVSHYEPLHRAPAHDGDELLPVTDNVAARIVRLPLHGDLTVDQARWIAGRVAHHLTHGA